MDRQRGLLATCPAANRRGQGLNIRTGSSRATEVILDSADSAIVLEYAAKPSTMASETESARTGQGLGSGLFLA